MTKKKVLRAEAVRRAPAQALQEAAIAILTRQAWKKGLYVKHKATQKVGRVVVECDRELRVVAEWADGSAQLLCSVDLA